MNKPLLKLPETNPRGLAFPFAFFTAFMNAGGIVWGVLCLVFELYTAALIPFLYYLVSFINIGFWIKVKNFDIARFVQVLFSILLPFLMQWILGGYLPSGVVMIWSLLSLMAMLTFYKTKIVLGWLIVFISLSVLSFFQENILQVPIPETLQDKNVQRALLTMNFVLVSSMVFFLGKYTLSRLRKALKILASKHQELMASEEEIRQNAEELNIINETLENAQKELWDAMMREKEARKELKKATDTEIAKKNKDIEDSLNYAKKIQQTMLPAKEDLKKNFHDAFILLKARDKVSGDFYWFYEVEDKVFVTAVDCTGHGVPGAIVSMIGIEQITEIINVNKIYSSNGILDALHHGVVDILKQNSSENRDGMDLAFCVYDKKEKVLEFSGAKNPLIYIQNNELHIIKGDKQPIGLVREDLVIKPFTSHRIPINTETTCYMFSDGFQDQFGGPKGSKFMVKRLKEMLLKIHQLPMDQQKELLTDTMVQWMNYEGRESEEQVDDMLIVGFRLEG